MRKIFLSLIGSLVVLFAMAQNNDKMYKHDGDKVDVKIVKVAEYTIIYKYPGEDAEQTIGKLAVAKLVYGSGRTEQISEKVVVASKDDWENVQIIEDKSQIIGLKKKDEIRGKTSGFLNYHTAGSADKKATRKLKEAAAEMGAPFILMTSDNDARVGGNGGTNQGIKKGFAYTYN
jgi:hypothetical protein